MWPRILLTRLRQVAYLIAIAIVVLTAQAVLTGDFHNIPGGALAVGIMGGTLAASPYVIARTIEEHLAEVSSGAAASTSPDASG
jgi:hypothetical protein